MKSGRKRPRPPADPSLVPKVKKYLAENGDKTFVDVQLMARALRDRYREYSTKPEHAFYQNVEAAYNVVLHSYGLDEPSSDDSDDSDDLELLDDESANNADDRTGRMYRTKKKTDPPPGDREELIDISSDDGSDDSSIPPDKKNKTGEETAVDANAKLPPEPPLASRTAREVPEERSSDVDKPKRRKPLKRSSPNANRPSKTVNPDIDREKYASKITLNDVGGMTHIAEQICDLILHMKHPEVYSALGVKAPRGALLHGPPGSGKTLLANAIAGQLGLPIVSIVSTELVGGVSGESERMIRDLFDGAVALAPCILFIDEIDSVCGNRMNAQKDMEKRMVAQLLSSIDGLEEKNAQVLLLAATNNPDLLDPGLRRAGRLEQEIALGIPTVASRKDILKILCRNLKMDSDVDLDAIARLTPGYVGADLRALVSKSCTVAIKRGFARLKENVPASKTESEVDEDESQILVIVENGSESGKNVESETPENPPNSLPVLDPIDPKEQNGNSDAGHSTENSVAAVPSDSRNAIVESDPAENDALKKFDDLKNYIEDVAPYTAEQLSDMKIVQDDLLGALKTTKPCAIREGFATVPDVTWDDIGSLSDVRHDLQLTVLAPVKYPRELEVLGLSIPSGVLLCGPPGCGKTLLAKAIANEAGVNFISVKGPELLNMYVGESERAVRTCFRRARNSAPCVIFFDEFDSLCPKRSNNDISGATRVVNQLLTEMDGVESREGVFILAATNRPDIIDPAVLRPGRLDRVIFVGMPLFRDRIDILKAITKKGTKPRLGIDVDLEAIAKSTEGFTGADLAGLVRQAATQALTDFIVGNVQNELCVTSNHFEIALTKLKPSVSSKEQVHYEKLRSKYASNREDKNDIEMDTTESMDTV